MKFKTLAKRTMALGLALAMVCSSPVYAAGEEYSQRGIASAVTVANPQVGYEFSKDFYVFGDESFFTTHKTDESTANPTVTFDVYKANADGSNQQKICSQTLEGVEGGIELVTTNFIMITYGYTSNECGLLIDRRTNTAKKIPSYQRFGLREKDYNAGKFPAQHVNNSYLLIASRSDVSSQKAFVFNGDTGAVKKFASNCWDAAISGDTIYYIFEKKDGFYLGSCTGTGAKSKVISKLEKPEGAVFATILSCNGKTLKYKVSGQKNKTYTYKLK